jgi:hypothetical protein
VSAEEGLYTLGIAAFMVALCTVYVRLFRWLDEGTMKRRFIQDRETLEFHEVSSDYTQDVANTDSALWGDRHYEGMRASDGADISTRSKHREYMRQNGLTTIDDYGHDHWQKAAAQRDRVARGDDPNRKHDIVRAIAQLESTRR